MLASSRHAGAECNLIMLEEQPYFTHESHVASGHGATPRIFYLRLPTPGEAALYGQDSPESLSSNPGAGFSNPICYIKIWTRMYNYIVCSFDQTVQEANLPPTP